MASIREQIIQAVVAALDVAGLPAPVERCILDQLDIADEQPSVIAVQPWTAEQNDPESDRECTEHALELPIACVVKRNAASGEAIDSMADPLYCWVVQRVMADPTLGGLASRIGEVGSQLFANLSLEKDTDAMAVLVTFRIVFNTAQNDPTVGA